MAVIIEKCSPRSVGVMRVPLCKLVAQLNAAVLAHLGFDELEDAYEKAGIAGTVREGVGW